MLLYDVIRLFSSSVLGKRLGKSMGVVAKEVKAMSQEKILAFEKAGEVTIAAHCLKLTDIKVLNLFYYTNLLLNISVKISLRFLLIHEHGHLDGFIFSGNSIDV